MELYEKIQTVFSSLPHTSAWPELDDIFQRNAAKQPAHWGLPILICEAVGGKPEAALPAAAALGCQHLSILLIDDLLDADPRGEHHRLGMPAVANLAAGFQAAGDLALAEASLSPQTALAGLRGLQRMTLQTALGQHWDTQAPQTEDDFWRVVQTKSAPFFGAAFYLGALCAGASLEVAETLEGLGRLYGELIQVHDDLGDVFATPAGPDWAPDRVSLPILFATLVDHPDKDRFLALRPLVKDPEVLREAQEILCRCGAVAFCVDQILQRAARAREVAKALELPREDILQRLIDDLVYPVLKLFEGLGVAAPAGAALAGELAAG